jgi:hypothetical protein
MGRLIASLSFYDQPLEITTNRLAKSDACFATRLLPPPPPPPDGKDYVVVLVVASLFELPAHKDEPAICNNRNGALLAATCSCSQLLLPLLER